MTIRLNCPNCEAVANVKEQSLGRRGRCKKCGHVFALARPGGEAASAISDDASAWKRGSEPASPTNLPEQFGRYRIMKKLGQGGMGAVYLAHDSKLEREVALKVPYFAPSDGPQAVQRFEREARAAATLNHPNLCPIYDVGEIDGIHYLTMPYFKGKPLSEAMGHDQTVTEVQAAAVALKIAQALQEAHDNGIIHRDLKPGNIMVNRRRELIVMDFGLARVVDADDRPITRTGHVLGTALYMAPEQAAGDLAAIGPTADVYSLGVMLYELLTGRRPFEGPWSVVIGLKSVKDPDPPSKHRPGLSPILNAICHKAIAKEPEDRHPTMSELAQELGAFLKSAVSPAVKPSGTAHPDEDPESPEIPESVASYVLSGIVSEEVISIRQEKPGAQSKPSAFKKRLPASGHSKIIAAWASVFLLFGIVIFVATNSDFIKHLISTGYRSTAQEKNPNASASENLTPPSIKGVPSDAKYFQGIPFKVFDEELTWHGAKARCEQMGGHLATIKSENENKFITSIIFESGLDEAWLGATDELVEGQWIWVDGTQMEYQSWATGNADDTTSGQPDGIKEHYLMTKLLTNGHWSHQPDRARSRFHPGYICEWNTNTSR